MFEVGKLYVCEKFHLMLYPDQETAAAAARTHLRFDRGVEREPEPAAPNSGNPATYATFWSKRFGKPVLFSEKNIPFLVLNDKEEYVEVLVEDKKGWIIFKDWLNLKEFC